MSADLFAEFSNQPSSTSTPSHPNNLFGDAPNTQDQKLGKPQDFSHFTTVNHAAPAPQAASHWSSFQSLPNSMSDWGAPVQSSQPPTNVPQQTDDDDGWGDFEVAEQTAVQATPAALAVPNPPPDLSVSSTTSWDSYAVKADARQSKNSVAQSSTLDLMSGSLLDFGSTGAHQDPKPQTAWPQPETKKKVRVKVAPRDPNVLFDADDFELQGGEEYDDEFDEFGDFEAVEPAPKVIKATPPAVSNVASSIDLLGLDEPSLIHTPQEDVKKKNPGSYTAPLSFGAMPGHKSKPAPSFSHQNQTVPSKSTIKKSPPIPSTRTPNPASISGPSKKKTTKTKLTISSKTTFDDDEWAAWDDFSAGNGGSNTTQNSDKMATGDNVGAKWDWDAEEESQSTPDSMADNVPPPINVPPPAILLSAFPELLASGDALFKPVSGQSATIKQKVLSNPKTVRFLQGYVLLATTAARIIAGRKHRWHRDKILAKSMSISAAGSKGMKLAGVDKTQSTREDREATDVVEAWREHVGRLRSAVAAANSAGQASLKVPELTEQPQVQTAKMVPTAPKPCIICGLKREERVTKVDIDVEDSFGEWWVDHWGHRACKNFWIQHERQLRQR
ncbi:hypothetical protein QQS21_008173 [Conoideocrella luteorostrata]|uniref:Serine/threonine-protein kinase ppk6 n=1 Tax=Conoideocrella luteorostrata TaxID=1105319 RepID=A0AAJ0FWR6_9HYPO|nr:hypothetical protein QQS21_008173 [Conoideocrella luteorostrata]